MPLRARLLDMGEVGAVRAIALRRALAESTAEPSVLVARAASPALTLGEESDATGQLDLDACEARGVPVVRLPGGAPAAAIASGSLLVTLIVPLALAPRLGLPSSGEGLAAWLADLVRSADGVVEGAGDAATAIETAGETLTLTLTLAFDPDPRLTGVLTGGRRRAGEGAAGGAGQLRSPAELGEALLVALEARAGLELVPSMPMPDELDAVYAWERRLGEAASATVAGPAA